jgi:hypothetical protein
LIHFSTHNLKFKIGEINCTFHSQVLEKYPDLAIDTSLLLINVRSTLISNKKPIHLIILLQNIAMINYPDNTLVTTKEFQEIQIKKESNLIVETEKPIVIENGFESIDDFDGVDLDLLLKDNLEPQITPIKPVETIVESNEFDEFDLGVENDEIDDLFKNLGEI